MADIRRKLADGRTDAEPDFAGEAKKAELIRLQELMRKRNGTSQIMCQARDGKADPELVAKVFATSEQSLGARTRSVLVTAIDCIL